MNLKFHDESGNEIRVIDLAQFAAFVRAGRIQAHTMIYDETRAIWQVAAEFPEYHHILSSPQVYSHNDTPSYAMPPDPQSPAESADAGPLPTGSVLFNQPLPESKQEKTWPSLVALLSILAGGILLFVVAAKYSINANHAAYRVGLAIGISFWVAVGSYLVWRFMLNKKRGFGMLMFGCGFLLVSVFVSLNGIQESRAEKLAQQDLTAIIRDVMSGKTVEAKDYDEKTYGRAAGVIQALNNYLVQMQTEMQSMNKEVESLELETMLTEKTLKNAETISSGQARTQKMREILDRYEAKVTGLTLELPDKIQKMDIDENIKREFLAGFNSTKDEGIKNLGEFFSIERAIVTKAEEIFDFLKARQGKYKFQGSLLYFQSVSDEVSYNALVSDVQRLAEREEDWRRNNQRRMQQQYENLQRGTKRR